MEMHASVFSGTARESIEREDHQQTLTDENKMLQYARNQGGLGSESDLMVSLLSEGTNFIHKSGSNYSCSVCMPAVCSSYANMYTGE
jgi:hypothetical protein